MIGVVMFGWLVLSVGLGLLVAGALDKEMELTRLYAGGSVAAILSGVGLMVGGIFG